MRLASRIFVAALVALTVGSASATIINFTATLNGGQETPPNASTASGSGTFVMDTVANTLSVNVGFSGLVGTQTAAHIHGFAMPGVAAGILFPLAVGSPIVTVWNFLEAQEASIIAGLTYVNIHSNMWPGGEIRGQILQAVVGTDSATMTKIRALYR